MKHNLKVTCMAFLAIMVWLALSIQFYISTVQFMSEGRTFGGALAHLWSYFTIQNNFLVALAMTVLLLCPASKPGAFFSKPSVLTALGVYIIVVGLVYQIILRPQHTQYGWFAFCNEIFHTFCPPMYIFYWLAFVDTPKLPYRLAINWLAYPLAYCFYVLLRGAASGYYPYSFINPIKLGYLQIGINSFFLMLLFLSLGLLLICIKRSVAKPLARAITPLA